MEGIAGVQMASVARSLKKKQYEAVQQSLVREILAAHLSGLAGDLDDEGLFGIPPARLEAGSRALQAWQRREDHD